MHVIRGAYSFRPLVASMPSLIRGLSGWFFYGLNCTSVRVRLLAVFLGLVSGLKQAWRAIHIRDGY